MFDPVPWQSTDGASDPERMMNWLARIAEGPAVARRGEDGRQRLIRARRLIARLFGGTPVRQLAAAPESHGDLKFLLSMAAHAAEPWGSVARWAIDQAERALQTLELLPPPAPWDPPIASRSVRDQPLRGELAAKYPVTHAPSHYPSAAEAAAIFAAFKTMADEIDLAPVHPIVEANPAEAPNPAAESPATTPTAASPGMTAASPGATPVVEETPSTPTAPTEKRRSRATAASPDATYLTVAQAAQLANVAEATIRAWLKRGSLPQHRAGRVFRVKRAELEAFLKGRPDQDRPPDPDEQAAKILARRRRT
jgi:excisionase family DNA binding protein